MGDDMMRVSAAALSERFGDYCELAQQAPLAIISDKKIVGYFISSAEYEEYQRIKYMLPRAYAIHELGEGTVHALATSHMSERHEHLNDLLDITSRD